jgi:hypothetical protein
MRIIVKKANKKPGTFKCPRSGCWCGATDYRAEAASLTGRKFSEHGRTCGEALRNLLVDNARALGFDKKFMKELGEDIRKIPRGAHASETIIGMLMPFLERRGITLEIAS